MHEQDADTKDQEVVNVEDSSTAESGELMKRRDALRKMAKLSLIATPGVIALLSSRRAMAASFE